MSAYDWAGSLVAMPIGLALPGPQADAFGLSAVLWGSVAAVVGIVVPMLFIRGVWDVSMTSEPISMAEAA